VPLYGDMSAYIEMAMATRSPKCPYLIQRDGAGLTHGKLKGPWDTAAKAAGVSILRHDLRRTALTNMIEAGIAQHEAMLISGHRSAVVFDRYLITSERSVKRVGRQMAEWMANQECSVQDKVQDRASKPS
jgi:integrase